ncbi:MAG: polysaccharide biosynthesis protein [Oscillospiraceae bacterium]|nr:polysaccharide biosynthesis protein [Oscillospiraceae bacterium]
MNANTKRIVLCIIDFFQIVLCGLITCALLKYCSPIVNVSIADFYYSTIVFSFFFISTMAILGVYKQIVRYSSLSDLLNYFASICIASFIYFLLVLFENYTLVFGPELSKVYSLFFCFLTCISIIASRVIYMQIYAFMRSKGYTEGERTMIIGAGQACKDLVVEMKYSRAYIPVCIIDDNKANISRSIEGVCVVGTTNDIVEMCIKYRVQRIFLAMPSLDTETRHRIMTQCIQTNCRIKQIPSIRDAVSNENLLNQTVELNVEDLLGRDAVTLDNTDFSSLIKDKICLVTGGGGSIGSELCRQIAKHSPKQLIILDICENGAYELQQELMMNFGSSLDIVTLIASIRDYSRLNQIFRKYRPEIVFHAAAHKHVPMMEVSPSEAVKNNIVGTLNLATLADYYRVRKFIMISTDKAVNPTNVMGASKRCCEMIMQYMSQEKSETEFITTRFGNVLGSNGSVIPLFCKQIENGLPVTVTHPDIIRYFMTIPEAVSLVLTASMMAKGGEIFVLDMGQPVKITTLAENLIKMYGKVPYKDVPIVFSGLRPGEKLFEELLMNEEGLKNTRNKKLFIGNQIEIDSDSFMRNLSELKTAAMNNDDEEIVELLLKVVPTFTHNN